MIEILMAFLLPVILLPQIAAGLLARQLGRKFWFWISFLLPVVSLILLLLLADKKCPGKSAEEVVA